MIIFVVVLFCLIGASSAQQLHEKMTPDELLNIFHTTDEVPDYQVVPIIWPKLQRRSRQKNTQVSLTAFGEDIKLQLNPVNGILAGYNTPIYIARKKNDTVYLALYKNLMEEIHSQMFEDFEKGATIVVSEREKKKKIVGTINSMNLAIKSLPSRLARDVIKQKKLIANGTFENDYHYHIIHRINNSKESNTLAALNLKKSLNSTNEIPDTIYPEILVVVDNGLFKKLGGNVWEAVPYLLAFWNGVDIKYRTLKNPEWKLNIAAIVLAEVPVFEYIEKHSRDENSLVANRALYDTGKFWFSQNETIPKSSYDLIATMTSKDMCYVNKETDECNHGILGNAFVGGVCSDLWTSDFMSNVALIHDEGIYDGVHVAAHELGHLFGANHDNNEHCVHRDGFIMAASAMHNENSSYWSSCSKKEFDDSLKLGPSCLFNLPYVEDNLPKLIPGKYLTADEQCVKVGYRRACDFNDYSCEFLKCTSENSKECKIIGIHLVDGTKCGDDKVCFRRKCLNEVDAQFHL